MKSFLFILLFIALSARAELQKLRWTSADQKKSDWGSVIADVGAQLKIELKPEDFKLVEQKSLSGLEFIHYQQTINGQVVKNAGIRIWKKSDDRSLVQMIALIQDPKSNGIEISRHQLSLMG